jgi:hypothetical protein
VLEEVSLGEFWGISLYPAVESIPEKNNFYRSLHDSHTKGRELKITFSAPELIKFQKSTFPPRAVFCPSNILIWN